MASSSQTCPTYQTGEVILNNCEPYVKVLYFEQENRRCSNCFAEGVQFLVCSCQVVKYCNEECKKKDWEGGHSIECKSNCYWNYCRTICDAYHARLCFRLYAKMKLDPESAKKQVTLHDNTSICMQDLLLRQAARRQSESLLIEVSNLRRNMSMDGLDVQFDYILSTFSILKSNCIPLMGDDGMTLIGYGVYLEGGIFRHSCKPTAFFWNSGTTMRMHAITNIDGGAKPLVCYLHCKLNRSKRNKYLITYHRFYCYCSLCDSEEDANVDYVKMLDIFDKIQETVQNPNKGLEWRDVYTQRNEAIDMLRKMCYEYDPCITDLMADCMRIAVLKMVNAKLIRNQHDKVLDHLRITYGESSQKYKRYNDVVSAYFKKSNKR